MRVDYHMHTSHSFDCDTSLGEVAECAVAAGLDRVCITDHDTLEGALRLAEMAPAGLDVIVGCEVSTLDGSQVIGMGLKELVPIASVLDVMDGIKAQGGQVLIPHPFRHRSGVFRNDVKRPAGFLRAVLERLDLIEAFNMSDTYNANQASYRFAVEHGLAAVASSDAHSAHAIGTAFVEFADRRSADIGHLAATPRSVWFADQRPAPELLRIRRLFHRLPGRLQDVARATRRGAGLGPHGTVAADASWQHDLPVPVGAERPR